MNTLPNVIMIGDFLKDLDDEHALVVAASLHRMGVINLSCVVGNLAPAEVRARGAKATLVQLGLPDIPVGIGLPVFEGKVHPYETSLPYMVSSESVVADGHTLLVQTLKECGNHSVILVLQSGLTDAAKLLCTEEDLCCEKLMHVAIMGGVEVENGSVKLEDGFLLPNNANNNTFDWNSAVLLYRRLQECNIPMVITTREAAYAVQLPVTTYDELTSSGHPVAECLKERQLSSYQKLWEAACSEPGAAIRGTLPADRNRAWFIKVFCAGKDPGIPDATDITPYVLGFNLYDPLNMLAAIPDYWNSYFQAIPIQVKSTMHYIVGLTAEQNGIRNVDALRNFLVQLELYAFQKCLQPEGKWTLRGEDTFDNEYYSIPGNFTTEAAAIQAAREHLEELEKTQPTASSGGQGSYGIQDRVYVVDPQGKVFRIT